MGCESFNLKGPRVRKTSWAFMGSLLSPSSSSIRNFCFMAAIHHSEISCRLENINRTLFLARKTKRKIEEKLLYITKARALALSLSHLIQFKLDNYIVDHCLSIWINFKYVHTQYMHTDLRRGSFGLYCILKVKHLRKFSSSSLVFLIVLIRNRNTFAFFLFFTWNL